MSVILVRACLRGNAGGSPTAAVLEDAPLTDDQRREIPAAQSIPMTTTGWERCAKPSPRTGRSGIRPRNASKPGSRNS
ncbi:hypothetical protein B0293_03475 [Amycolatopsis azurea DSM 43854]|uniref:Uncharacterized protein n=1 Tax=Amycolatopsis azurea DSM 43854 TaxID=1238180 RepID=A0ABX3JJN1_9PSEU|nr:hypothetical protein B0293_03475 [Amycolatopsis azurea DSM 43854]